MKTNLAFIQGAVKRIIRKVAEKHGLPYETVKKIWLTPFKVQYLLVSELRFHEEMDVSKIPVFRHQHLGKFLIFETRVQRMIKYKRVKLRDNPKDQKPDTKIKIANEEAIKIVKQKTIEK